MAKITIHREVPGRDCPTEYTIDLDRKLDEDISGLICYTAPFWLDVPLVLEISIRKDGSIAFRGWHWDKSRVNPYLHTSECSDPESPYCYHPTQEQIDTVNGLFSGRIKFEGLKLAPGKTLQDICPIDVKAEEKRINKKIYLA